MSSLHSTIHQRGFRIFLHWILAKWGKKWFTLYTAEYIYLVFDYILVHPVHCRFQIIWCICFGSPCTLQNVFVLVHPVHCRFQIIWCICFGSLCTLQNVFVLVHPVHYRFQIIWCICFGAPCTLQIPDYLVYLFWFTL